MRWYVAPFALFVVALVGCGPKESDTKANEPPKLKALIKEDVKVGTGPVAETGDIVWMRYSGKLANGSPFDSNANGEAPLLDATLGKGGVIKGWEDGIPGMREGGKRKLSIPSNLGYGPAGNGPKIPPNSDLIFDIELVRVLKKKDMDTIVVKTTKPGSGKACKDGDTVTIEFEGKTLDGDIIDSSKKAGGKPATFRIGKDELMARGLDSGVEGMKIGETRVIELAPPLGMPPGIGAIKRQTIQTYTVTLVKIQ